MNSEKSAVCLTKVRESSLNTLQTPTFAIMKKHIFFLSLALIGFNILSAQLVEQSPILVRKTSDPIVIDGNLDEAAWKQGIPANNFWLYFPTDSIQANTGTEIYMMFDDKNLYVGAKCYSKGDDYVVPTLRRDYRAGSSDNITLVFDPFNDRINAFVFGMTPLGVRREALIFNGGQDGSDFETSWDNTWTGEAGIHDGYWVAEFKIPFKTLRYNEGQTNWRFNSYRFDTQSNETSTWMRIPRNQIIMNLAFMGQMNWEEAPPKPGANVSVIPYTIANSTKDFEEGTDADTGFNFGGDAKIAVTSGMNLDLTFNPDFSQVEVDQQVTNLTRFEIFLPERRQFFQENSDLFGRFGSSDINPFFSRRIGLSYDTTLEQNVQNAIYYGARLSGKLDENWRLGLLNMQAADDPANGLPSYNYTVAALQRKVFARSNIGAILVNKQTFEDINSESDFNAFNRVVGLDYNLASSDNSWTGKAFYHQMLAPENLDNQFSYGANLTRRERNYEIGFGHDRVGENYDVEVGFVPRTGFSRWFGSGALIYYPTNGSIIQHAPYVEGTFFYEPEFGNTDHIIEAGWEVDFKDFSGLNINVTNRYTYLFEEFNPTRADTSETKVQLLQPGDYYFTFLGANYASDRRKDFSYSLSPTVGQFFNGWRYGLRGSFNFNLRPRARIELNYNINRIDLPDGFDSRTLILVGPRIDVTFSRSLFLTTFFQYNNQIDNVNVNARLQWRFKPVSDFFLVYTDNYYSTDFRTKNRAIVAKLTYWLNI